MLPDPNLIGSATPQDGLPHKNKWGVTYMFKPGAPGAHPVINDENKVIKDITQWEKYLKTPSLEGLDWGPAKAVEAKVDRKEKMVGIMSGVVNILKDTHIKSADDLTALQKKLEGAKDQFEAATTDLATFFSSVTAENAEKIEATMADIEQRMDQLEKEGEAEADRLKKEAEALGLDIDALGDIF